MSRRATDSFELSRLFGLGFVCLLMLFCFAAPDSVSASPALPSEFRSQATGDNDADGIPGEADPDDDNDGVADSTDSDPVNAAPPPAETPDIIAPDQDTDNYGIDNVMDPDHDDDAVEDAEDPAPFTPVPVAPTEPPVDSEPDTPSAERPQDPDTQNPTRPAAKIPEPIGYQPEPADSAPLVVSLPSTGTGPLNDPGPSSIPLLAAFSVIL